jgi:hypothetical protein
LTQQEDEKAKASRQRKEAQAVTHCTLFPLPSETPSPFATRRRVSSPFNVFFCLVLLSKLGTDAGWDLDPLARSTSIPEPQQAPPLIRTVTGLADVTKMLPSFLKMPVFSLLFRT